MRRALAGALCVGAATAGGTAAARAAFDPVSISTRAPAVVRIDRPVTIRATVTADAGALDGAGAPLRLRIKLAGECGGAYAGTPGPVAYDRVLRPQPRRGAAYRVSVRGRVRLHRYGPETVCAFLETSGEKRQYATSTDRIVKVTRACTRTSRRLDGARRALARARRQHRSARVRARLAAVERRAGAATRRACR